MRLLRTGPLLGIPHLAPHLDRTLADHVQLDRQQHVQPVLTTADAPDLARLLLAAAGVPDAELAAHDLFCFVAQPPATFGPADEFLELHRDESAIGAEFHGIPIDFVADAPDHLETLQHSGHIADRDEVLDLQSGEGAGHLVEAGLVPLQGLQPLVGPGEGRGGALQGMPWGRGVAWPRRANAAPSSPSAKKELIRNASCSCS